MSARRDWGCLQCDNSVREALKQLRLALIPSRFQQGQLQARAQVVLRGMEGPFFRDYALNAFVGRVGACWGGERALDPNFSEMTSLLPERPTYCFKM